MSSDSEAYSYACFLLGRQSYTESALCKKLFAKGFSKETPGVLSRLKKQGIINDLDYAIRFIETKDEFRPSGEYKLTRDLLRKGVSKDNIGKAFSTLNRHEVPLATHALQKKFRHSTPEKEKALRFLASRGFGYAVSKDAVNTFIDTDL